MALQIVLSSLTTVQEPGEDFLEQRLDVLTLTKLVPKATRRTGDGHLTPAGVEFTDNNRFRYQITILCL